MPDEDNLLFSHTSAIYPFQPDVKSIFCRAIEIAAGNGRVSDDETIVVIIEKIQPSIAYFPIKLIYSIKFIVIIATLFCAYTMI